MRYGIFSDIHANLEALEAVVEAYKNESIDTYFCLGDFVGYGADPEACICSATALGLTAVAGNHDRGAVDLFPESYFNRNAAEALRWTKGRINPRSRDFLKSLELSYKNTEITLVHGTLERPEDFDYLLEESGARQCLVLMRTNILFVGHTHVAGMFTEEPGGAVRFACAPRIVLEEKKRYIVNVGSVGQPRDNNPLAAYCVYDSETKLVEVKRVQYDVEKARQKIINAGLPRDLGDRLVAGR
jgi:predicted phosphodiesterase